MRTRNFVCVYYRIENVSDTVGDHPLSSLNGCEECTDVYQSRLPTSKSDIVWNYDQPIDDRSGHYVVMEYPAR